jgi:hypothetical protein
MILPIIVREGETMNQKQGEETEILQKLADLKTYQEYYDQANYAMQHSKNEAEVLEYWHLMNKAEKKYIAVLNQIETCGFIVKWNKERQEYEAYKHHMSS